MLSIIAINNYRVVRFEKKESFVVKKSFVKVFFIFISILGFDLQARIPLGAVHGTYDYVAKESKRISPLVGVIWWHLGIARNIYTYGDEDKGSFRGLTKLSRKLFYELNGHFASTQSPRLIAYHISPVGVREIIRKIELAVREGKNSLGQALIQELFYLVLNDIISWADTRIKMETEKRDLIKPSTKRLKEKKDQHRKIIKALKDAKRRFKNVKKNTKNFESEKDKTKPPKWVADTKDLNEFVEAIAQAYEDSGYFDAKESPIRPFRYGLHALFTAFMYDKFDNKKAIQEYFDKFEDKFFVKDGKVKIAEPSWLEHFYIRNDVEVIEKNFLEDNKTKKSPKDAKISIDLLGDISLEAYAFAQIMKKYFLVVFPDQVSYKNAFYKTYDFPDCVESMVRSLVNSALFKSDSFLFKATRDDETKFGWKLDNENREFYEKSGSPDSKGLQNSHNGWTNVVENREFCSYMRVRVKGKPFLMPKGSEGFVPVKNLKQEIEKLKAKVNFSSRALGAGNFYELQAPYQKKYLLFDFDSPDIVAYEITPRFKNLIVLIDKLFGLNLFEQSIESIFLNAKFNKTYIDTALKGIGFPNIVCNFDIIDSLDGKKTISLKIKKEDSEFKIVVYPMHARAEVSRKRQESSLDITKNVLTFFSRDKVGLRSLDDLLLFALNRFSFGEMSESGIIKSFNADQLEQIIIFCCLHTVDKKIVNLQELASEEFGGNLTDEQKKAVYSTWIRILKSLPIVDGQNHMILSTSLISTLRVFVENIVSKANFLINKDSYSYLLFVLYWLDSCLEKGFKTGAINFVGKILEESSMSNDLVVLKASKGIIEKISNKEVVDFYKKIIENFLKKGLGQVESKDVPSKILFPLMLFELIKDKDAASNYFMQIIDKAFEAEKKHKDNNQIGRGFLKAIHSLLKFHMPADKDTKKLLELFKLAYQYDDDLIKTYVLSSLKLLVEKDMIKKADTENIKFVFDAAIDGLQVKDAEFRGQAAFIFKRLMDKKLISDEDDKKILILAEEMLIKERLVGDSLRRILADLLDYFINKGKFDLREFLEEKYVNKHSFSFLHFFSENISRDEALTKAVFAKSLEWLKSEKGEIVKEVVGFLANSFIGKIKIPHPEEENSQKLFKLAVNLKGEVYSRAIFLKHIFDEDLVVKTRENEDIAINALTSLLGKKTKDIVGTVETSNLLRTMYEKQWLAKENVEPVFVKIAERFYEHHYENVDMEIEKHTNLKFNVLIWKSMVTGDNIVSLSKSLSERVRKVLPDLIRKITFKGDEYKKIAKDMANLLEAKAKE
jgi:hypothetical protein